MSTITRERIEEILNNPLKGGLTRGEQMELARIALASLEAEPVGYFGRFDADDEDLIDQCSPNINGAFPLFTSPPAPVSVPDERYQHLSELYHAQEKRLFKLAQRIKGPSFDKYAYSPSQAIDVLESAIFGECEDDCRAAMLQGAEPVTTANKLPDGWVACSERMPEVRKPVYIFHPDYGVDQCVWYDHQEGAFVWGDETRLRELESVSHWMEMPKLPSAPRKEV
ncbi:DUF551 domain-containing protein [Enterobacter hormaechei]|uniref:DUF551 domain-containing protein n=1 Tax=Enterobacter hormaechei TaxID=158836 RepID=UPI000448BB8D|nr:DUF551 domain-containing protein [Enterobacter hormaechei]EUL92842.1 hypothetical protein P826_02630 [Enterobacter hormaechei]TBV80885.1 DUF551 domain-containing protein [Enterobacter hormaechei]TKY76912.1 DUF551 domain-containing protein [Enterobacter hormaechei]